jgi:hypothetical protein
MVQLPLCREKLLLLVRLEAVEACLAGNSGRSMPLKTGKKNRLKTAHNFHLEPIQKIHTSPAASYLMVQATFIWNQFKSRINAGGRRQAATSADRN